MPIRPKRRCCLALLGALVIFGTSAYAEQPPFAPAGTEVPSVAEPPQLSTPACSTTVTPADDQSASSDLFAPEPVTLTGCTAEYTCGTGQEISCSGSSSCSVHVGYVKCDNNKTYCDCWAAGCDVGCLCGCYQQPGCVRQCCWL